MFPIGNREFEVGGPLRKKVSGMSEFFVTIIRFSSMATQCWPLVISGHQENEWYESHQILSSAGKKQSSLDVSFFQIKVI